MYKREDLREIEIRSNGPWETILKINGVECDFVYGLDYQVGYGDTSRLTVEYAIPNSVVVNIIDNSVELEEKIKRT